MNNYQQRCFKTSPATPGLLKNVKLKLVLIQTSLFFLLGCTIPLDLLYVVCLVWPVSGTEEGQAERDLIYQPHILGLGK